MAAALTVAISQFSACSNHQDQNMNNPVASVAQPLCVGRYVIDVPTPIAGFHLSQSFKDVDIEVQYPSNPAMLEAEIQKRVGEEKLHKKDGPISEPNIGTPDAEIFVTQDTDNLFTVRGFTLKQDTSFFLQVQATKNYLDGAKISVRQLLASIIPRDPLSVPKEHGLCIDHGFIPGQYAGGERVTMTADLQKINASMTIMTNSEANDSGGNILDRMSLLPLPLANFISSNTTIVRRGNRSLAGRSGDEYGYVTKDDQSMSLQWSVQTGKDHAAEPMVEITLDTTTGLAETDRPAFLAVWDEILTSLKRRI